MDTKVRKDELLVIVRANRDKHRGVFEAAIAGYRKKAVEIINAQIRELEEGRTPEIRIVVVRPEDHTKEYDQVIKMLELDTRDEIVLDSRTFARFVMDDWEWKTTFVSLSNRYAAGATQQAYGVIEDDD